MRLRYALLGWAIGALAVGASDAVTAVCCALAAGWAIGWMWRGDVEAGRE